MQKKNAKNNLDQGTKDSPVKKEFFNEKNRKKPIFLPLVGAFANIWQK